MRDAIIREIYLFVRNIVSDTQISRDEQAKRIFKKLWKYSWVFLDYHRIPVCINIEWVNTLINHYYKNEFHEWTNPSWVRQYYDNVFWDIADIIIRKQARTLFDNY